MKNNNNITIQKSRPCRVYVPPILSVIEAEEDESFLGSIEGETTPGSDTGEGDTDPFGKAKQGDSFFEDYSVDFSEY